MESTLATLCGGYRAVTDGHHQEAGTMASLFMVFVSSSPSGEDNDDDEEAAGVLVKIFSRSRFAGKRGEGNPKVPH